MRKTFWAVAVAFLLTAGSLLSAGSAQAADTKTNRANNYVLLAVEPIGLDLSTLIAPPILLGAYLGQDWLVSLEYGRRSFNIDTGSDNGKISGSFVSTGATARWFPGTNSFNLGLAVYQRNWDVDFNYTVTPSAGANIPVHANLKANATVPALIIGNQWIMDFGLVVGLDWIVLSTAASATTSGTIDPQSTANLSNNPSDLASAQKSLKDGGDFLNTVSGLPGLFVLTLGWSF